MTKRPLVIRILSIQVRTLAPEIAPETVMVSGVATLPELFWNGGDSAGVRACRNLQGVHHEDAPATGYLPGVG